MKRILVMLCVAALTTSPASAQNGAQFYPAAAQPRVATGVKLSPTAAPYFTSGITGNTGDGMTLKEQAKGAMKRLEANITAAGSTLADVVFVRAYLRQAKTGVDYTGWEEAWRDVFGAAESAPARTVIGVPRANDGGSLVEIEYVTLAKDAGKMAAASAAQGLPATNPRLKPFGTKDNRILAGAGVMPGSGLYWTAGLTAPVLNASAPTTSYESRGNMETQARNTLGLLKENIAKAGLTLADVVFVRAWLGPDINNGGRFDSEAWNKAYGEFFNNPQQPHKPARVTMTTPTFASNTGGPTSTMIEIEFVAAFPDSAASVFGGEAAGRAVRYGAPEALFASGVAGKPGSAIYLSSSTLPGVAGDMKTQATAALESIGRALAQAGGSFRDVTFLRAYLVPGADGSVDRNGWNAAYSAFFNKPSQPSKPGRVTIPVVSLPSPEARIAIDVVAALP